MTASGTSYTRTVITVSGLEASIIYVSGVDYSRIDLVGADGYAMDRPMVSGLLSLINYVYAIMPSGLDAAPGDGLEW